MKKAIIVHGRASNPEDCWFPWLRRELIKRGFIVQIPYMPNPDFPKLNEWLSFMEANFLVDENTFLIGHSIGCQAILRYLERINTRVGGVILVGGWLKIDLKLRSKKAKKIAEPWLNTPINFENVLESTTNIVVILSDNDRFVPLYNVDLYKEHLNAKVIVEIGKGHFSNYENIKELPVVLEELLAMKTKEE